MADMIDDVVVGRAWVNAHTASGIDAGAPLVLQNKGPFSALVCVSETAPPANAPRGFRMAEDQPWGSELGDVVWLRSEGDQSNISVQEA